MTDKKEIRAKLKKSEPYRIEKELLPELFFKDENEQWIFFYAFCRRLSDEAIGIRVYLDKTDVYRKELQIIENNLSKITHFLFFFMTSNIFTIFSALICT